MPPFQANANIQRTSKYKGIPIHHICTQKFHMLVASIVLLSLTKSIIFCSREMYRVQWLKHQHDFGSLHLKFCQID